MNFETLTIPNSVLESTQAVMNAAQDVRIEAGALELVAQKVDERLAAGIDDVETAFGTAGSLERDTNMVFFETAVNFCFWADSDDKKWKVEKDGQRFGGWYGLAACFDNAAAHGIPVYDAAFMSNLTLEDGRELFAGIDSTIEIPLLEQRVNNLNEAGLFLLKKHDGQALNMLTALDFSAPRIVETIVHELPSYRDGAEYNGSWVWLLKRAQILPSDLSQLSARYPEFQITDCEQLTAFADYRLPQVLRHLGALAYSAQLAATIDGGHYIEAGSTTEIEIRAATIQATERIKTILPARTSADIDLGLWLMSQDMRNDPTLEPHHRTPGYFY